MPALSAYTNTENTSAVIIMKKGFQIWYDENTQMFCAEKNGWDFFANSVTELLGIVSIYEFHSPKKYYEYWWRINQPWLIDTLKKSPEFYIPIGKIK